MNKVFNKIINDIENENFSSKIGLSDDFTTDEFEVGICLCIHDSSYDEFNRIEYPYTPLNYKKEIVKQLKKYEKGKYFNDELENLWVEIFLVTRENENDSWTDEDLDFCRVEYY